MFKNILLLSALVLCACGGEESNTEEVSVYLGSGGVQCVHTGSPVTATEAILIDQGVTVFSSSCGYRTDISHPAVCGAGSSSINIHTIGHDDLAVAESLGFNRIEELTTSTTNEDYGYSISDCPTDESSSEGIKKFTFLPYKSLCTGLIQRTCLIETSEGHEQLFYNSIAGFEYEWGSTYTLYAKETIIENPPADSSELHYELIMTTILSNDTEGTLYEYTGVDLSGHVFTRELEEYYFLGNTFTCAENINCDDLIALNNSGALIDITFEYRGLGEIALIHWN